jgi:hypothetical protein
LRRARPDFTREDVLDFKAEYANVLVWHGSALHHTAPMEVKIDLPRLGLN